jgi:RNA polymerase sigma-70 factor (ECF subfamily)
MAEDPAPTDLVQLVAEHHAALYRYAYRLCGSAADAEDLTQQTFLMAQAKLDQLRSAETSRGWLYAILRNNYLRTKRKRVPVPAVNVDLDVNGLVDRAVPPDWTIDREELQAAINGLPDEFKIVVLMFYFEDRSYRDIAADLNLPIGTVMSRLSRAKQRLRERAFAEPNEAASAARAAHRS